MFQRAVVLSILAAVLAGCVHTRSGADFASLSRTIGPPKSGQARIVVFREQQYTGLIDQGWDVKLDGVPLAADLKAGTFAYADRPAGRHQLSSEMALFPGTTQRDISVAAGRTYFFLAKLSDRARTLNTMSAIGGLAAYAVGSAVTSGDSNPGPVDFIPLEEGAAREAIADLRTGE